MKIPDKFRDLSPGIILALWVSFFLGGSVVLGVYMLDVLAGFDQVWRIKFSDFRELPETIVRRWETKSRVPTVRIDIKFRHFEKLRRKREEALSVPREVVQDEPSCNLPARTEQCVVDGEIHRWR